MTDIHSCSYYCDRPDCVKAQRDELRERLGSMTDRELMQQALEALTCSGEDDDPGHRCTHCDDYVDRNGTLRAALRDRLAQPEQEPIKESSVTHSHLWIGELWRKEKNNG